MTKRQRPTLYILTGTPFAGKTTLGKEISRRTGARYIGLDDLGKEQAVGASGERIRQVTFDELHKLGAERTRKSLIAGKTVVYDSTIYRKTRDDFRLVAHECGAEAITIFVDIPKEITYQRWRENQTTLERQTLHPEQFIEFTDSFEPPDATEKQVVFHTCDNLIEWIKQNIKDICNYSGCLK
jgi:tRNA uridine 5-carbamoylmethylation protein Kti12